MDNLCLRTGSYGINPPISVSQIAAGRPAAAMSRFSFRHSLSSLLPGAKLGIKGAAVDDAVLADGKEGENGSWVLKILRVKHLWTDQRNGKEEDEIASSSCADEVDGDCGCEYGDDDGEIGGGFDRNSFSKLLKKVSLHEAKLYAQMSYLGNLAYDIPNIKPRNLLKRYGLQYVTSSIEKREQLASADKKEPLVNADLQKPSTRAEEGEMGSSEGEESGDDKKGEVQMNASAAFHIVASAASYLNARTRSVFGSSEADVEGEMLDDGEGYAKNVGEMASFMATTDSVTAVVAAKEEVKQAVADDLNSVTSSPCEWYICDDSQNATRFFVIQGSETISSWQANLLFEPIQFEGSSIFVHRGIYEAAKGMYQQMLPEIRAHMKSHGRRAKLRFTGHSLGGSLSLLINLMLLIRGEVPVASLLPVITFGSPTVMCGGDELLRKLGLPRNHVRAVTMHRDIVPRAFSCNYPNHVAELLKAVNGNFRNHPCLNHQKVLYAPMGELVILQPDSNYSPQHDLLPHGSGLYLLASSYSDPLESQKLLRAARLEFLNSPHPLEILSDRAAYGNGGTIQRDHDMDSYLKCVRSVIRRELSWLRKAERQRRRKLWWPAILPRGIVRTGSESLKMFSKFMASQHMHLMVLLLLPARLWLI